MEVTDLDVTIRREEPDEEPIRDAIQALPGAGSVTVEVHTDAGVRGTGSVRFGRIQGAPDALAALIEHELRPEVVGTDPAFVRRTHRRLLEETEYHGSSGITRFGIAAIDTALWDCLGRAKDVPCWELWGGARDRIPAYAMVGWLNHSPEKVARQCERAVDQGFRAVKIKVGADSLEEDVRRVEQVREAVGDDVEVMVDANQALTKAEAIRRGKRFAELGCAWFEEPIPADAVHDYAALVDALSIPVATGENLYSQEDFARFLRMDAVDVVQPDLRRAGGPSALTAIGSLVDAFGRRYASHGGGAVQANVMATLSSTHYLETGFIDENTPFSLVDGHVEIPQGPGFSWE